jgi:hypothetical protein
MSIKGCLATARSQVDPAEDIELAEDLDRIQALIIEGTTAGKSEKEAALLAVQQVLGQAATEHEALVRRIDAAVKPDGYGKKNKVFTEDAKDEALRILREKLGRVSANPILDPEILQAGITVAGYHIEAGLVKFQDWAKAVIADMHGFDVTPYLRQWYEAARYQPGVDTDGMTPVEDMTAAVAEVMAEETTPVAEEPAPEPEPEAAPETLVGDLLGGRSFGTIVDARKRLAELTGEPEAKGGTVEAKAADEQIEQAGVLAAREIVSQGGTEAEIFDKLVALAAQMPNLGTRTSTSIAQQAYSTPLPLAYVASRLGGVADATGSVIEPTAGNGALLIEAEPASVIANEMNKERASFLESQGFDTTSENALDVDFGSNAAVVVTNPPFGIVKDEEGATVSYQITDQYKTNEIDHAISLHALDSLADDGKAVLIIGGPNKLLSDKARSDAYNGKAKRGFFYTLYNQYRVTDHFTVSGDLYAKQGAAWPVDVIVIEGRGKSDLALPAAALPRQVNSVEELKNELPTGSGRPTTGAVEGGTEPAAADGGVVEPAVRGVDGIRPEDGQRGELRAGSAGQPEPARPAGGSTVDDRRPERIRDGGRAGTRPNPPLDNPENPFQAPYKPASTANSVGTLVPTNMAAAIERALKRVADAHGGVDAYVAKTLQYDEAELGDYFSAEQVDALALALDNMERGKGFIIGDQTGVGKGRVVAGVLRWAKLQGKMPIFVTQTPDLYGDMIRDLTDIGMPDINPTVTNTSFSIPMDQEAMDWFAESEEAKALGERPPRKRGKFLKAPGKAVQSREMAAQMSGDLPAPEYIFTTYSQMQTVKGARTQRMDYLEHFAKGAIVVFDESHNAGGTTSSDPRQAADESGKTGRAGFSRQIAREADGVMYSSATYAKRPEVMDLYFKTDMGMGMDASALSDALSAGGVPLQQTTAAMLAESGQYIRREKSFDGIDYATVPAEADKQFAENASEIMRDIMRFDELKQAAINGLDQELKASARQMSDDNSTGGAGAQSTNFTSVMHNLIAQMLLTLKVKAGVNQALAALENNEKPLLALSNTMGSAIEEYAAEMGLKPGDYIALSFGDLMKRYLEKSRRILEGGPYSKKVSRYLTDEELGPTAVNFFNKIMDKVSDMGFDNVPISPIDALAQGIREKGYSVGEITGRGSIIDLRDGKSVYANRLSSERSAAGKRKTVSDFNNGLLDVIILNQSGATGISLHSSPSAGSDTRNRVMILVQAELNIDTHMQMLGRVNRTGQLNLPRYEQLVADIPAEKRPASILAKKMAMLNANTTASRDSALKAKDTPDFMNQYGDQVAAQVMGDNPDWHFALGSPLRNAERGEGLEPTDAMRKVSGRIPVLSLENQEIVYAAIEEAYEDLLDTMKRTGQNILEATTLALDAKLISSKVVQDVANDSGSPFAAAVVAEEMNVKRLGKPHTIEQIQGLVLKNAGMESTDNVQAGLINLQTDLRDNTYAEYQRYVADLIDNAEESEQKRVDAEVKRLQGQFDKVDILQNVSRLGAPVLLQAPNGVEYHGYVGKVERKGKSKNPVAPGTWRVVVYVADAARQFSIPFSRVGPGEGQWMINESTHKEVSAAFTDIHSASREKRTIMTGQMLAAYGMFNRGQLINFEMEDGSLRQGILMPRGFDVEAAEADLPVRFETAAQAAAFMQGEEGVRFIHDKGKAVRLGSINNSPNFVLRVPSARGAGGRYFLNQRLIAAMGGVEFVKAGKDMRATFDSANTPAVVEVLYEMGVELQATSRREDALKYGGAKFSRRRMGDRPAYADFSDKKIRMIANEDEAGAYLTRMSAEAFIDLTSVSPEEMMKEEFKTSNIPPYEETTQEFDPAEFDLEALYAVPTLRIDENGRVVSHEGRHRAAALLRAGAKTIPVQLLPGYEAEWNSVADIPDRFLPQQFTEEIYAKASALKPRDIIHVPRRPNDLQVAAARRVVGPELEQLYAQAGPGGQARDAREVRAEIKSILSESNSLLKSGRLKVVQSEDELPAHLQHEMGGVKGVVDPSTGNIYIVADNVGGNVRGVLLHEVGVHHGLRSILGEKFADVMRQIRGLKAIKNREVLNAYAQVPESTRPDAIDEEALAYLVESKAAQEMGIVRKVIAAVRAWLFKHGIAVKNLTTDDMLALAAAAARAAGRKPQVAYAQLQDGTVAPILSASEQEPSYSIIQTMRDRVNQARGVDAPTSEFYAENQAIREKDRPFWGKVKKELKRQFAPGGLLPDKVFELKIWRDSQFNVAEIDIKNYIAHYNDAIMEDYGVRPEDLDPEITTRINDAMTDNAPIPETIKENTRVQLQVMKDYINIYSTEYATILFNEAARMKAAGREEASAAKIDLMNTIIDNLNKYQHRSYRAFDDAMWPTKVSDEILDNARAYLKAQFEAKAQKYDEWARKAEEMGEEEKAANHRAEAEKLRDPTRVGRLMRMMLKEGTAFDTMEQYIKESKLGSKDLSILKHKKDIAPEIRALLGEYVDVRINFAKTASKQNRLIFNQKFLDQVVRIGLGDFLWTDDDAPPDATKLIATGETYSPLSGYYTMPEIEQAFRDVLGKDQMADWYRTVVQWNGVIKYGKTVLSPTTAMRNWMSAFFFAIANGHFDMTQMAKSVQSVREYFTHKGSGLAYLRKLQGLGVVYDTPYAGEMMRLLKESKIEDQLTTPGGMKIKRAMDFAQKFYQFGDDFWKILGFENEVNIQMKHKNLSREDAEVVAAERVRNTYPTYSMTGKFVNNLRRFPLAGTFVSFPSEIVRTTYHILRYLKEDMADPQLRPLAIRRIAGLAIASGFAHGLQFAFMAMAGVDDDEEEAFRQLAAPWQKNSNILPLHRDEKGNLRFLDLSFLDPYNYWKRPINAILRDQPYEEMFKSIAEEVYKPFFGTDIAAGAIIEVVTNTRDTGGRIFNPQDTVPEQTAAMLNHLWKNVQPGIASNVTRTMYALQGKVSPSGRKYNLVDEAAAFAGIRVSTHDPRAALFYKSFEFRDMKRDSTSIMTAVARDPNKVSDDELKDAFERAMTVRSRAYIDMARLVSAARSSGLSELRLRQVLSQSGISKKDVSALLDGRVPTYRPSKRYLQQAVNKARVLFPEMAETIEKRRETLRSLPVP